MMSLGSRSNLDPGGAPAVAMGLFGTLGIAAMAVIMGARCPAAAAAAGAAVAAAAAAAVAAAAVAGVAEVPPPL